MEILATSGSVIKMIETELKCQVCSNANRAVAHIGMVAGTKILIGKATTLKEIVREQSKGFCNWNELERESLVFPSHQAFSIQI